MSSFHEKAEGKKLLVGSFVNVSCTANVISNAAGLKLVRINPLWAVNGDKGIPLTKEDGGVVDILETNLQNTSASTMLQLQASVINGTKWPKAFKCAARVRLPDRDEFIHYGKTYYVHFDSELHMASHLADIGLLCA